MTSLVECPMTGLNPAYMDGEYPAMVPLFPKLGNFLSAPHASCSSLPTCHPLGDFSLFAAGKVRFEGAGLEFVTGKTLGFLRLSQRLQQSQALKISAHRVAPVAGRQVYSAVP